MSSKLRGLIGRPLDEPSGQVRPKVAKSSHVENVVGPSLPPHLLGPTPVRHHVIRPTGQGTKRPSRGASRPCGFLHVVGRPWKLMWGAIMKLSSARDGSWGSLDAFQERVKILEASLMVKEKVNSYLEALLAKRQRMVFGLGTMLGARNVENTAQAALIFVFQSDLDDHENKLQEALDVQQTIREEYVDLSSELAYEFHLYNTRVVLSYMDSKAFMERMLARGKALFKSRMEIDQVGAYREGSSLGTHDEELADPLVEEVAGQDIDHQAGQHADDGASLDSMDLDLAT
uniref:Uncharacterized protein n=1 Tax=Cannabis sativa TaxID=3483 RepID=A0A803PIX0_CANSA